MITGSELRDATCGRVPAGRAVRGSALVLLLVLLSLPVALLLWSAPALGFSHRGHEFAESIAASGECALSKPSGVAAKEGSDSFSRRMFVADRGGNGIDEFREEEEVPHHWVCQRRFSTEVPSPGDIAVDNASNETDPSKGDIYVVSNETQIYKFDSSGKLIKILPIEFKGAEGEPEEFNEVHGIAVDRNGVLRIYEEEGLLYSFTNAKVNKFFLKQELELP